MSLLNGALPLLAALIVLGTIPRSTRKTVVLHYRLRRPIRQVLLLYANARQRCCPGARFWIEIRTDKILCLEQKSMKHFDSPNVFIYVRRLATRRKKSMIMTLQKQPPILEDLRNHSPEELAELRILLSVNSEMRPDPRRPGFFEIPGLDRVYYIFKYPNGSKILLVGVWDRDRVAEMAALSCTAA
ncbi:MAG TPA: hypothetical protein VK514_01685 [Candidatus Acidoferrum sp.]|nr:hypothetical protein [Candidatus Acidoferrum sp.]